MRHLRLAVGAFCLLAACVAAFFAMQGALWSDAPAPPRGAATAAPADASPFAAVLVAAEPIRRGHRIERRMVATLRVDGAPPARAFTRADDVAGGVALEDIDAGQIVLRGAVKTGADARPGLSILVPPGMRAVALRVTDEIAVGNFVRPDDRVDIQLVLPSDRLAKLSNRPVTSTVSPESALFLQNVQVLSVGEALTADKDNKAQRMQNLTVAVTPEQALHLAAVKQVGMFYLTLRHPTDERVLPRIKARVTDALLVPPSEVPRRAGRDSRGPIEMILGDRQVDHRRP
jgi:pilus assembly protein CpaB